MAHDLGNYVEVKDRIAAFREKHPEGSLQPLNPEQPYALEALRVGDSERLFIVYTAAAYRTPDDPRPGVGVAWEPFPGLTPYTKNSELMNAETSAWGRAIVASLGADASAIATAEDVRNRSAEEGVEPQPASKAALATQGQVKAVWAIAKTVGWDAEKLNRVLASKFGEGTHPDTLTKDQAKQVIDGLKSIVEKEAAE